MANQLMIAAEKKCRHLYMGDILSMDEYALWEKRRMENKDLIKIKEGQVRNIQRTLKRENVRASWMQ